MDTDRPESALCLTCNYSLRGLSSNRCPECGREFDLANPKTINTGMPIGPFARAIARGFLFWPVNLAAFILLVLQFWRERMNDYDHSLPQWGSLRIAWKILAACFLLAVLLRVCLVRMRRVPRSMRGRFKPARLLFAPALALVALRAQAHDWPLRLAMTASRHWLEMDAKALQGKPLGFPYADRKIGFFHLTGVYALADEYGFEIDGGAYGFAFSPSGPPHEVPKTSYTPIGNGWYRWTTTLPLGDKHVWDHAALLEQFASGKAPADQVIPLLIASLDGTGINYVRSFNPGSTRHYPAAGPQIAYATGADMFQYRDGPIRSGMVLLLPQIRALVRLGKPAVIPLTQALADPRAPGRENIIATLALIGPDAKEAVPALAAVLNAVSTPVGLSNRYTVETEATQAASALAYIGADAQGALIEALDDRNTYAYAVAAIESRGRVWLDRARLIEYLQAHLPEGNNPPGPAAWFVAYQLYLKGSLDAQQVGLLAKFARVSNQGIRKEWGKDGVKYAEKFQRAFVTLALQGGEAPVNPADLWQATWDLRFNRYLTDDVRALARIAPRYEPAISEMLQQLKAQHDQFVAQNIQGWPLRSINVNNDSRELAIYIEILDPGNRQLREMIAQDSQAPPNSAPFVWAQTLSKLVATGDSSTLEGIIQRLERPNCYDSPPLLEQLESRGADAAPAAQAVINCWIAREPRSDVSSLSRLVRAATMPSTQLAHYDPVTELAQTAVRILCNCPAAADAALVDMARNKQGRPDDLLALCRSIHATPAPVATVLINNFISEALTALKEPPEPPLEEFDAALQRMCDLLPRLCHDANPDILNTGASGLKLLQSLGRDAHAAAPTLMWIIKQPDSTHIRSVVQQALCQTVDAQVGEAQVLAISILAAALHDSNYGNHTQTAEALAALGPAAWPALQSELASPEGGVASVAYRALIAGGAPIDWKAVLDAQYQVNLQDRQVLVKAIRAMNLSPRQAADELQRFLVDSVYDNRVMAINAAMTLNLTMLRAQIEQMALGDIESPVRTAARAAIKAFDGH